MHLSPRLVPLVAVPLLGAALAMGGCGSEGSDEASVSAKQLAQLQAAARSYRRASEVSDAVTTVPSIAGERVEQARQELRRAGLRFSGRFPGTLANPDYPTDCLVVTSQGTATGTRVREGSYVVGTIGVCPHRIPRISHSSDWPPWD